MAGGEREGVVLALWQGLTSSKTNKQKNRTFSLCGWKWAGVFKWFLEKYASVPLAVSLLSLSQHVAHFETKCKQ